MRRFFANRKFTRIFRIAAIYQAAHQWAFNLHNPNKLILIATCFWLTLSFPLQAETLRIGLSLPLSGNAEKLGRQFLAGANLATGVHNTFSPRKIQLVMADDGCNDELGKLAAHNILAAKPDLVVGYLCNEPAYIAASKFRTAKLPILIAGAQSDRLIKDREHAEWRLWRISPGDSELAKKAGEIFSVKWQNRSFAIVDDGTVHGRTLADDFRAVMEEAGHKPQFNDTFRPTQSTQARLVRRLKKAGVTHVFVAADAEDIAMIATNANELGIALEIAGSQVLSILPFLPKDRHPPAGLLALLQLDGSINRYATNLTAELQEKGIDPEPYVYRGYAAMQVAIDAVSNSTERTIANLNSKTFSTVLGPVKFSPDGANQISPYALFKWQGDGFERVGL